VHPTVAAADASFREASAAAADVFAKLKAGGELEALTERFITASGGTLEEVTGEHAEKKTTYEETLALIREGKSLDEIAKERKFTAGTIIAHLERLSADGVLSREEIRVLAPEKIVDNLAALEEAFVKTSSKALTPAYKRLKGRFSYDELKLARLLLSE
jgi:DNA-binding CsgD family transcriptional regulator